MEPQTQQRGRRLYVRVSKVQAVLRRAGRQRNLTTAAERVVDGSNGRVVEVQRRTS